MRATSTLRPTAPAFCPCDSTGIHITLTPPSPYISSVEPYHQHPVTYVQIGPYPHVPLYIYRQVRGIYIGDRFHPQQEQYYYSHVPPPLPPPPPPPVEYEWWPGEDGEGAWIKTGYGGEIVYAGDEYGDGYAYAAKGGRRYKKGGKGKKGGKKKEWGNKGQKRGGKE